VLPWERCIRGEVVGVVEGAQACGVRLLLDAVEERRLMPLLRLLLLLLWLLPVLATTAAAAPMQAWQLPMGASICGHAPAGPPAAAAGTPKFLPTHGHHAASVHDLPIRLARQLLLAQLPREVGLIVARVRARSTAAAAAHLP